VVAVAAAVWNSPAVEDADEVFDELPQRCEDGAGASQRGQGYAAAQQRATGDGSAYPTKYLGPGLAIGAGQGVSFGDDVPKVYGTNLSDKFPFYCVSVKSPRADPPSLHRTSPARRDPPSVHHFVDRRGDPQQLPVATEAAHQLHAHG